MRGHATLYCPKAEVIVILVGTTADVDAAMAVSLGIARLRGAGTVHMLTHVMQHLIMKLVLQRKVRPSCGCCGTVGVCLPEAVQNPDGRYADPAVGRSLTVWYCSPDHARGCALKPPQQAQQSHAHRPQKLHPLLLPAAATGKWVRPWYPL